MPSRSMDFDGTYNLSVVSGQTIEIDLLHGLKRFNVCRLKAPRKGSCVIF